LRESNKLGKEETKGSNHYLSLKRIKHSFILVDDVHKAHL